MAIYPFSDTVFTEPEDVAFLLKDGAVFTNVYRDDSGSVSYGALLRSRNDARTIFETSRYTPAYRVCVRPLGSRRNVAG